MKSMKKISFLCVLLLIFYANFINRPSFISSSDEQNKDKEAALKQIEKEEFLSGDKNDELFFNLAFGMTVPEVQKTLFKLKKENVLESIESKYGILAASYTMNYHEYSNLGRLYCFFNDNKLRELQIDSLNQNGSNMIDLFIKKYGECSFLAENDWKNEYHWINGNRHLTIYSFHNSGRILIQYIDTTEKMKGQNINLIKRWNTFNFA
jgi:hypothetical protein